jgi:Tfp pilus assembly protein PilF
VLLAIAGAAAVALVVATRVQVTQWSDSVTFFERAVRIEPGATLMRFNLGMALVAKARYAEAVQVLDRAIAQSPYNGWGNAMMGVAKAGLGRDMEAEAWFLQALRLDPNAVEALCGLGELYTRAGQPARAATFYARLAVAAARSRPDLRELALRRMREGAGGP